METAFGKPFTLPKLAPNLGVGILPTTGDIAIAGSAQRRSFPVQHF